VPEGVEFLIGDRLTLNPSVRETNSEAGERSREIKDSAQLERPNHQIHENRQKHREKE
jgi:hypothetical protein